MRSCLSLLFAGFASMTSSEQCPFLHQGTPPSNTAEVPRVSEYKKALDTLDIKSVFEDLYNVLTDSQECWPADSKGGESSYGGLFIRLAWHCSGTYRDSDGRGGCAGGRQRFSPENSWDDNVNLDKARALLVPIKEKYGDALSWGDLMVFSGTASIYYMGGPIADEICGGRIDQPDGHESEPFDSKSPCDVETEQGNCPWPNGADTVGLIYVNPQGVNADPKPELSAPRIREVFGRMDFDDSETVALIGGGHAFGKSHGACPDGAGDAPKVSPDYPWQGNCGSGKGNDTVTSGIEGYWTTKPFQWDNEYFVQLKNDEYELHKGSGDAWQWKNKRNGNLMMTTDLALTQDDEYNKLVTLFANDMKALEKAFASAWDKLVTSGGGWVNNRKCIKTSELEKKTIRDKAKKQEL